MAEHAPPWPKQGPALHFPVHRKKHGRSITQALDLPIAPKNTENIRSKLKRLASRGIIVETEPGLFTQPHP